MRSARSNESTPKSKISNRWRRGAVLVGAAGISAAVLGVSSLQASASAKFQADRSWTRFATIAKPSKPVSGTSSTSSTPPSVSSSSSSTTSASTPTSPASTTTTTPPSTGTSTSSPAGGTGSTTQAFLQGAYVGPAAPAALSSFASATGTHPTIASDYLPADSGWAGMDGANSSLTWLTGAWAPTHDVLSLGVPMIPTNSSNVPVGTLAAGATGAYNTYFQTLANTLIAAGDGNAYLRLGWEFDGNWYAWDAASTTDEANYAAYFRQIVTTMRAVPGAAFQFVWNPDASAFVTPGYSVAAAYPGSAYVDLIGLDVYDQSWATPQTPANAWNSTTLPALTAASQFAAANAKRMAICEWGVTVRTDGHGLGDDPLYVNNMISWMESTTNRVAYESYFNYNTIPVGGDTNAAITGGGFPSSLAAFVADLG